MDFDFKQELARFPMLGKDFPEDLWFIADRVAELMKPALVFRGENPFGDRPTATGNMAIPLDGPASCAPFNHQSACDGPTVMAQINLSDIPAGVLPEGHPQTGMIWIALDLSDDWLGEAYFDPRPAETISWAPRSSAPRLVRTGRHDLVQTPPPAVEEFLPEIASTREFQELYEDWASKFLNQDVRGFEAQIGGHITRQQWDPEPGYVDVAGFYRQAFGDSGSFYLSYSPSEKAWKVCVQSA